METVHLFTEAQAAVLENNREKFQAAFMAVPGKIADAGTQAEFVEMFCYFLRLTASNGQEEMFNSVLSHANKAVVAAASSDLLIKQTVTKEHLPSHFYNALAKQIKPDTDLVEKTLQAAFDTAARSPSDRSINAQVFTAFEDNGISTGSAYLHAQNALYRQIADLHKKIEAIGDVYSTASRIPAPPKR